jgi:hypothetical protein
LAVLLKSHRLGAALAFWAMMQLGGVLGALWAAWLKSRIERGRLVSRA